MNEPGTRSLGIAPQEGTMVRCPLKGFAEIGAGRCVEWQKENGCHCENALPCLKLVEEHLRAQPHQEDFVDRVERNRKLDDVRELKARSEQIEKARPAPMPAEEKPMPRNPYREGRVCSRDGCKGPVADASKTGVCTPCQQGRSAHLNKSAAKPEKTRAPRRVKANGGGQTVRSPEPVSGDLASLLKAKAAELREQADHIERAAQVLSR